ncbi:unnamed protein product [Prunus armeniaca]|uniref:Large ribosomal subunit protein bL28c n=1 Tax=Prunus armeniaca TaxID=36596 RepID=A0A6J5W0P5_PRUAR|nr:unnamed protein product [Prunus armeniaca]
MKLEKELQDPAKPNPCQALNFMNHTKLTTPKRPKSISTSSPPALQPIVACRICPFTGKKSNRGNEISFSAHKTKKLQFVNLQYKRVWWEAGKHFIKLRSSTKALKTIDKNGIDAVAKVGIDLHKL